MDTKSKIDTESKKDGVSRRGFLGAAAVTAAAGVLSVATGADGQSSQAVKTGKATSISDPGPGNKPLDAANPDSRVPPPTDGGGVPTFKYPFAFANKRVFQGGWSREVTARELPVSKSLAGVNMRLDAGGIRELHWHTAVEWAIMLYGGARITAIDAEGRSFVRDTKAGDLWYFPTGIPHSIQGLEPDGAEFLLVFDDGNFSEFETVLLSELMRHTPREIMAKNFGMPETSLATIRNEELFIFSGSGARPARRRPEGGGRSARPFAHRLLFSNRTTETHKDHEGRGGADR